MKHTKPDWVKKHESKGKKATRIKNKYYLYKISSKWDSKKKRAKKVTEKYLGRVTKEGIIPPRHERIKEMYKHITVKEYGASTFLQQISTEIIVELKKFFPYEWKELFCLAILRFMEKSPLKNIRFYYMNSFLSESIKEVRTSQKFIGPFLRRVGMRRELMKDFMRSFMIEQDHAIIDLTHIFSYSENVINAMLGHNKDKTYVPQINLILIYSLDQLQPVYFRQVPGSLKDVSTVIKTVNETVTEKFILIGDKGLYSENNVVELKKHEIDYIFALKRNSSYISYDKIISGKRSMLDGYFLYNKRHVWYYAQSIQTNEYIITYLDSALKAEEENDLARRIMLLEKKEKSEELTEKEKGLVDDYKKRLFETMYKNGTLSVRTNLDKEPEEIYQIMKSRVDVEQAFDTFKNVLEADKTCMRDDNQVEGWFFINFIALQLYYKIYALLLSKKMLNNFSPQDVIIHLKRITALKINNQWQLAEIPKKSRTMSKNIGLKVHIT